MQKKINPLVELGKDLLKDCNDINALREVTVMLYEKLEEQDQYIELLENILNSNTNLH